MTELLDTSRLQAHTQNTQLNMANKNYVCPFDFFTVDVMKTFNTKKQNDSTNKIQSIVQNLGSIQLTTHQQTKED